MSQFFSIITATRNAAHVVPSLLGSLAGQTCQDFELVMQDGQSTDETVAIVEAFRPNLPALSVSSEPDTGIYDAWNKALERARGEWVIFLGADDALYDATTLQSAKAKLENLPESVFFACGHLDVLTSKGELRVTLLPRISDAVSLLQQGMMPSGYPALFLRKSIFENEPFVRSFRIAGDLEFLCRKWNFASKAVDLGFVVTRMYGGGVSDTPFALLQTRREIFRIMDKHFPGTITFRRRIFLLAKSYILHFLCCVLGKEHAPIFLDWVQILRGRSFVPYGAKK
jgi:glycosyltransferase involved in cell wall biosynthesis